jgi:2-dehydropantoate 2-reductase
MREGLSVAGSAGIRLESLPDMPLALVRLVRWLPEGVAARIAAAKTRRLDQGWPLVVSTLQSVRRGRPTEIDYLNGEVVRLGAEVGVPTPLNARIVELVHQVERTGAFLSIAELLQALDVGIPTPPVRRPA